MHHNCGKCDISFVDITLLIRALGVFHRLDSYGAKR